MPLSKATIDAQAKRTAENEALLVEDENESRKLWKSFHGGLRGWSHAWQTKFLSEFEPEPKNKKSHTARPVILDNKLDKRIGEPNAHSIARTDDGWVVITYRINGKNCSIDAITKPEGKQFAVSRLLQLIKGDIA